LSSILLISLALLLVAFAASAVMTVRSGEARIAALAGLFALLAARQGLTLWNIGDASLAFDAHSAAELLLLLASGIAAVALVANDRTRSERDRAEALHWDSMEAVRRLSGLSRAKLEPQARLEALLDLGRARFGLEVGIVSRVEGDRYTISAIRAPHGYPLERGALLSLDDTFCRNALGSERPIEISRIAASHWAEHPAAGVFGFGAYLGATIRVDEQVVGTLCFGGSRPKYGRFTATDKDLIDLMAQWIAAELPSREATPERPAPDALPRYSAPPRERRDAPPVRAARERGIDVNQALRRMERNLRRLAGSGVELELELGADLPRVAVRRLPFVPIVESLVANALRGMPEGGRLRLETATSPVSNGAAPGFVTLKVCDSAAQLDAEALTNVFEDPPDDGITPSAFASDGRLALPTVYRLLQRADGDLSVDVEHGRGRTTTVFLPVADAPAASRRSSAPPLAPGPPPA
jgi:hypothetical protein